MKAAVLKMVKVIVNFTNYESSIITYFAEIHDAPITNLKIRWDAKKFGKGTIDNIQVVDGKQVYNIAVPEGMKLEQNFELQINYPNQRFVDGAKKTHIVTVSFCLDELPKNLEGTLHYIVSGIEGSHHPVVDFVHEGFYQTHREDDKNAGQS